MQEDFSKELRARVKRDFDHRNLLIKESRLTDDYDPEMEKIHMENAAWLDKWINRHGWPDKKALSPESWEDFKIVILHAISCPDFIKKAHTHFSGLKTADNDLLQLAARLEDRICYHEGRPQTYGSIIDWDTDGRMVVVNMSDSVLTSQNRAKVGWGPVENHLAALQAEYSKPPADIAGKKRKYEAWLKKRGWRV